MAVLVGDWTRGDAAIGRFIEAQGRSGVPLYLWYGPGKPAQVLPQVLTPGLLAGLGVLPDPDAPAADPGFQHLGLAEAGGEGGQHVAVDQQEIGHVAGLEAAQPVLREAGMGGARGEGGERLPQRELLLRAPAAGGLALRILAGNGGGEAGEGVRAFHRETDPKARGSRASASSPRHRRRRAIRPQPRLGHAPVRGFVRRLHRGDGAILAETRQVRRIDDLGMLDPPAAVALIGLGEFVDGVEHLRIGGVANGVDRDLEAVHGGAAHQVLQLGVAVEGEAALRRRIGIGALSHAPREPSAPSA